MYRTSNCIQRSRSKLSCVDLSGERLTCLTILSLSINRLCHCTLSSPHHVNPYPPFSCRVWSNLVLSNVGKLSINSFSIDRVRRRRGRVDKSVRRRGQRAIRGLCTHLTHLFLHCKGMRKTLPFPCLPFSYVHPFPLSTLFLSPLPAWHRAAPPSSSLRCARSRISTSGSQSHRPGPQSSS